MSRKVNCWDNALIKSFFDHLNLKEYKNLKEAEKAVKIFMDYYNNYRYQQDLKKMTPVEYRNHLLIV